MQFYETRSHLMICISRNYTQSGGSKQGTHSSSFSRSHCLICPFSKLLCSKAAVGVTHLSRGFRTHTYILISGQQTGVCCWVGFTGKYICSHELVYYCIISTNVLRCEVSRALVCDLLSPTLPLLPAFFPLNQQHNNNKSVLTF